MSRLLLAVLTLAAVAALCVPATQAQAPAATLQITDVPSAPVAVNASTAVIPVHVTLSISNLLCASTSTATFPVALTVAMANSTDAGVTVTPSTLEFQVGTGQYVVSGYSQSLPATVVVTHTKNAAEALRVNGTLTATLSGGAATCPGSPSSATPASAPFSVQFQAPPGTRPLQSGNEVPSPALGLVVVALAAVALVVSRRK